MRASSPAAVRAVLLAPCGLLLGEWLEASYRLHAAAGAAPTAAASAPFAPLPVGEVYPPGPPAPVALVQHSATQLEAIRQSELELARQRALASALEEDDEAVTARLRASAEREEAIAAAEATARSALAARRAELDKQANETTLALKEQRLKGAEARAERLQLAMAGREREHERTMGTLREQLDNAEVP